MCCVWTLATHGSSPTVPVLLVVQTPLRSPSELPPTPTAPFSITAAVACTIDCRTCRPVATIHRQPPLLRSGKISPAGFVLLQRALCSDEGWPSSAPVFKLSVANRALDVGTPMPFRSLCLRHSQTHTPMMEELIDDFFNPARTQTYLQPDCSLGFNDDAITAHCSLLSARSHMSK